MPDSPLPQRILDQLISADLPLTGTFAFRPKLEVNRRGVAIIAKAEVARGPKAGKRGWLDADGRIWVKDYAHATLPDHWDVQLPDGEYVRVGFNGELL